MSTNSKPQSLIWFCPFHLDAAGLLRRSGIVVHLSPQAGRLLGLLVARPGEVVTRQELKKKFWPDQVDTETDESISSTTDDFDDNLNHLVKELREALRDNPEQPQYIQTIPKKGFAFICPTREPRVSPQRNMRPLLQGMGLAIAACALVLGLFSLRQWYVHRPPVITRISAIQADKVQQITIEGYRLGHHAKFADSDTPFLAIGNTTRRWAAGRIIPDNFDDVTLTVDNWTDTQIVVAAFSGRYGQNGWELSPGDEVLVRVWNPQTGAGPGECPLRVGTNGATTCPR